MVELALLMSRGRAVAARRAHNPEVVGSNPTPATRLSAMCVRGVYDTAGDTYKY